MKKIILAVLTFALAMVISPEIAFAAEQGNIYHFIYDEADGPFEQVILENGVDVYDCEKSFIIGNPNDFDKNKLTSCKVSVKYNNRSLNLDFKKDSVEATSGNYRIADKSDNAVSIEVNTSGPLKLIVGFDPIYRRLMTGVVKDSIDNCLLEIFWTYDGKSYSVKTALRPHYSEEIYFFTNLYTVKSSGSVFARGWDSCIKGLNVKNVSNQIKPGDNYCSYSVVGKGTLKYVRCDEDPDGKIFSNVQGYFNYSKYVKEKMNMLKITSDDKLEGGTFHLTFSDNEGIEYLLTLEIRVEYPKNFRVASHTSKSVTLSWDSVSDATKYILNLGNSSRVLDASKTNETIESLQAGKEYTFSLAACGNNYVSPFVRINYFTKPLRVSGVKLTTGLKYIKTSWKNTQCRGYEVQIASNSKFTKDLKKFTIKSSDTITKKIPKLKSGTTYYVRVRAYVSNDVETKLGKWSTIQKIKCR